jgi:TonB family protein
VSDPPGAAVIVDREYRGLTPLRLELDPGSTPVLVRRKGFEPWRRKVTLVAGGEMRLDAALVAVPAEPASPSPTPTTPPVRLGDMVSLSGAVTPPRNVSPTGPSFSRPVPKVREEKSVLVEFVVTEEGRVREARIVESGGAALDDLCLEAVAGRRYEPAVYEGVRVKVRLQSRFTFRPR